MISEEIPYAETLPQQCFQELGLCFYSLRLGVYHFDPTYK